MEVLRSEYEDRRKPLVAREAELRGELSQLRSTTMDDALELRKTACEQLRRLVSTSLRQPESQQAEESKH